MMRNTVPFLGGASRKGWSVTSALPRLSAGVARFDTPVGTVSAELGSDGAVTIQNVASCCHALDVAVDVPGLGRVVGDVGYGGNWFFVTHLGQSLEMSNVVELTRVTQAIQDASEPSPGPGGRAAAEAGYLG